MHSVAVRIERSVFEFRFVRGARHFPVDRIVFRRPDPVPGRHRAHVGVRLHFVQLATGQIAVRHSGRHDIHVFATDLLPVHRTRSDETGIKVRISGGFKSS